MMIKLKCMSCGYEFEVSDYELRTFPENYDHCFLCEGKLKVENLEEIVTSDVYKRAEEYLNQWLQELGGDETLSLIQRHKDQPTYKIYKELLIKRGFKIKE